MSDCDVLLVQINTHARPLRKRGIDYIDVDIECPVDPQSPFWHYHQQVDEDDPLELLLRAEEIGEYAFARYDDKAAEIAYSVWSLVRIRLGR